MIDFLFGWLTRGYCEIRIIDSFMMIFTIFLGAIIYFALSELYQKVKRWLK